MLYSSLRSLLFLLDAERSHNIALPVLGATLGNPLVHGLLSRPLTPTGASPVECMGLSFPNPVGLAAGLDKNGDYIDAFGVMGFGFIEVGTVTPRPQSGNLRPRMFRLPERQALINRMGFNNKGVDHLVEQVQKRRYQGVLGINIGKNADTPLEQSTDDYITCLRKVYDHADYVTVNISSPNTPGLRDLQHGAMLQELFGALKKTQAECHKATGRYTPITVKIAPDMDQAQVFDFADTAMEAGIDGIIATNTTFSRDTVEHLQHGSETGGLSGKPVQSRARQTQQWLGTRLAGSIPVIGAGGIHDVSTATDTLSTGATLIQLYTALIYQGPSLVRQLVRDLSENRR